MNEINPTHVKYIASTVSTLDDQPKGPEGKEGFNSDEEESMSANGERINLHFIYFGFYITFNTVQGISQWVVLWAEETSTYIERFCTVICRPAVSSYQLSYIRSGISNKNKFASSVYKSYREKQ